MRFFKQKPRQVLKTDLQDDLSPIEQAALAKLRNLRGENAFQHYEDPTPNLFKQFFNRFIKK